MTPRGSEWLRALVLGGGRVCRGIYRRRGSLLLSVGAMAVALLVLGGVALAAWNLSARAVAWSDGVQLVVYLEPDTTPERARALSKVLAGLPAAERVDYVPPDVAHARLASALGPRGELLAGIEPGFLPASIEVTLARGLHDVAAASPVVRKLRSTPGVESVEVVGEWAEKMASLRAALRLIVITLGLLTAIASAYVVGGALSLAIHQRRDELDVLRLVGATERFIRLPMMAEGAVHGLLGAGAAAGILYAVFRATAPRLELLLAEAGGPTRLEFLPVTVLAAALVAGALVGMAGSWLALSRHAHA